MTTLWHGSLLPLLHFCMGSKYQTEDYQACGGSAFTHWAVLLTWYLNILLFCLDFGNLKDALMEVCFPCLFYYLT